MLIPHESRSIVPSRRASNAVAIPSPLKDVMAAWNAMAARHQLPMCVMLNGTRRKNLEARIRESGIDMVLYAISDLPNIPFCVGDNNIGFKADFDFFVQRKSFTRVVEGFYLNLSRNRSQKDIHQERASGYARDALPDALKRMQDRKNGS